MTANAERRECDCDERVRQAFIEGAAPAPDLPPGYRINGICSVCKDADCPHGGVRDWLVDGPEGRLDQRGTQEIANLFAWAHYGRALHASLAERDARVRALLMHAYDWIRYGVAADGTDTREEFLKRLADFVCPLGEITPEDLEWAAAALRSGADGRIAESKETGNG